MSAERLQNVVDLAHEADFALGGMTVRPSTRELVAGGRAELLEPRIMQVLVALARRGGHVVSRDDLIELCWGGRTVGDDAINRCIAGLRKLSEAHGGFLITTVARVGYRLDESALPFAKPALPLLAVLAFDNLSGDPDMDWFSDGVSEEILQTVAQGSGLKVVGRASSFQFRGPGKAAAHVRSQLNATHVLDGSVRRSGSHVRISAHLIECAGETTLWSDRFDRDLSDIFVLQDEIAAAVAAALKIAFTPSTVALTIEPSTYDLFLRAQARLEFVDIEKAVQTLGMLERVVVSAPTFARAWALLAFGRAVTMHIDGDSAERLGLSAASAREAAEIALRLDDGSGVAHLALSYLEPFGRFADREALIRKALEAISSDPGVLVGMALFCFEVGRHVQALHYAKQAYDLDPLRAHTANAYGVMLGYGPDSEERYQECRALWEGFRIRWPDHDGIAYDSIAATVLHEDWDHYESLVETLQARISNNAAFHALVWFARNRRTPNAQSIANALGRARRDVDGSGVAPLSTLTSLSQLGMTEEVFELIRRASFSHLFEETGAASGIVTPGIIFASQNAALMGDIRFVGLCEKLGLVGYWLKTDRWPDCAEDGVLPYDFKAECRRLAAADR